MLGIASDQDIAGVVIGISNTNEDPQPKRKKHSAPTTTSYREQLTHTEHSTDIIGGIPNTTEKKQVNRNTVKPSYTETSTHIWTDTEHHQVLIFRWQFCAPLRAL